MAVVYTSYFYQLFWRTWFFGVKTERVPFL